MSPRVSPGAPPRDTSGGNLDEGCNGSVSRGGGGNLDERSSGSASSPQSSPKKRNSERAKSVWHKQGAGQAPTPLCESSTSTTSTTGSLDMGAQPGMVQQTSFGAVGKQALSMAVDRARSTRELVRRKSSEHSLI